MESVQTIETKADRRVKEFFQKLAADWAEVFWVYSRLPFALGQHRARRDLKAGKFTLKTFGKPAQWRSYYAEMLREPHGIILESVSDKMVGARMREEIRGYNSLVKTAIRRQHGKDFLDGVVERAKDRLMKAEGTARLGAWPK